MALTAEQKAQAYRDAARLLRNDADLGRSSPLALDYAASRLEGEADKLAPVEPTAVGSVVIDRQGDAWVRVAGEEQEPWHFARDCKESWASLMAYYGPVEIKEPF